MKILHICVGGPYTDDWNYQENMLTKYQTREGHDVSLIAAKWAWGNSGKIKEVPECDYVNGVGVRIYRLPIKGNKDVFYRYKRFIGFYETIEKVSPEVIFVHNVQFFDIDQIVRYAKTHKVMIYADNHADFSNSARTFLAKIFYKTIWRYYAQLIEPYTIKFFGVLPSRVVFLQDIYGLPKEKCELLVMGGDDELIDAAQKTEVKMDIRNRYRIKEDDFLIVTGGKIDKFKTQTLLLMQAVKSIQNPKVKLLVFGSVDDEYKEEILRLSEEKNISFVGFIQAEESYQYFASADLVVFPGRHSVYWEQVVAQGIPMLCKYWDGTTHVDIGGNVEFLMEDSTDLIKEKLLELIDNPVRYEDMKQKANGKGKEAFSYKTIARKSVGLCE